LVHVYHHVISLWFSQVLSRDYFTLIVLLYRQILSNILHGVHLLLSHDAQISHVTSCIHPILPSKRISSSIVPMVDPVGILRMSLTLELQKVLFHSEHLIELDQEDGVAKRNTSGVMKHNMIEQGSMSPTHERKSGMGD
jgi:hypothetical protein